MIEQGKTEGGGKVYGDKQYPVMVFVSVVIEHGSLTHCTARTKQLCECRQPGVSAYGLLVVAINMVKWNCQRVPLHINCLEPSYSWRLPLHSIGHICILVENRKYCIAGKLVLICTDDFIFLFNNYQVNFQHTKYNKNNIFLLVTC